MLCGATLQGAKNYIAELQRKAGMGMEQMQAKVKSDREVAHTKQMQQHQAQIRAAQIAAQQRAIQQMQQVGAGRLLGLQRWLARRPAAAELDNDAQS